MWAGESGWLPVSLTRSQNMQNPGVFAMIREKAGKRRTKLSDDKKIEITVSEKEKTILDVIRNLDYGEVRVVVTGGVPTRIEEIKKSIKL